MSKERDELQDVLDSLEDDLSVEDEAEAEESAAEPDPEAPKEDKPEEEAAAPEAEAPEGEEPGPPEEPAEVAEEEPDQEVRLYELPDGEKVTAEELHQKYLEWGKAYTQQRQADRDAVKQAEQQAGDRDQLYGQILKDPALKAFVNANPGVVPTLLKNPDGTRALMGDEDAVRQYWERYDLIKDDPELAAALADKERSQQAQQDLEARTEEVEAQQEHLELLGVAGAVGQVVDRLGSEFEGVSGDEISEYLLSTVGLGRDALAGGQPSSEKVFEGLRRIRLMYAPEGRVDEQLIRDRYELLGHRAAAAKAKELEAQQEHNERVDQELKEAEDRPASPPEGEATVQSGEPEWKEWQRKIEAGEADMAEFLDSI
jgi:hypothetical protein